MPEVWYRVKVVMENGEVEERTSQLILKTGEYVKDLVSGQTVMVLTVEPIPIP